MADIDQASRLGTKRKLNRKDIVGAAIGLIESEGLAALSSRKLAAVLGCEAMSLYHHYQNMDALIDAVVDELLLGQAIPDTSNKSPEAAIAAAALSYLTLAESYPHAFELIATRRWRTAQALAAVQSLVGAFASDGTSPDRALGKARILAAYLNGAGLALSAWHKTSSNPLPEVEAALPDMPAATIQATGMREDLLAGLRLLVQKLTDSI